MTLLTGAAVPGVAWKVMMTDSGDGIKLINSGKSREDARRGGNIVNPGEGRRDGEKTSQASLGNQG